MYGCLPVAVCSLFVATSAVQVGQNRVPEIRPFQPGRRLETLEHGKSLLGASPFRYGYRTVQLPGALSDDDVAPLKEAMTPDA